MASKNPITQYAGIGLVFGTAIGAGLSLVLAGTVIWAGVGTGIGLVLGAIVEKLKTDRQKRFN